MELYSCNEITQAPVADPTHLRQILRSSYGIEQATFHDLTGYEDCNFLLDDIRWDRKQPCKAVLKVTNPLEAKSHDNIDFQVKLCEILNANGIPCPKIINRLDGKEWASEEVVDGVHLPVRLFEVLPGSNMENFDFTPALVEDISALLAKFHEVADESGLSVTHVPYIAVEHRKSILKEMKLQVELSIISEEQSKLISECLQEFEDHIGKNSRLQEIGLIHSDVNETNILIEEVNGKKKLGTEMLRLTLCETVLFRNEKNGDIYIYIRRLLDFGDVHRSFRLVDIASTVLYLHLSDRLQQGVEVLAHNVLNGYQRIRKLPLCDHLLTAMKARLSCSLIYGLRTARINFRGGNVEYILRTQSNGWQVLKELHGSTLSFGETSQ